jgi:hypothetical protein
MELATAPSNICLQRMLNPDRAGPAGDRRGTGENGESLGN